LRGRYRRELRSNDAVGCRPGVTATIFVPGDPHEEEDISVRDERIVACNHQWTTKKRTRIV
jgi:hypothetical protein